MKIKPILTIFLTIYMATLTTSATAKLTINKALLQKLAPLTTSREVEKLLGAPTACVPIGKQADETAICQWKGDLKSNSTLNTLNITFEVDHVALIRAVTAQGMFYVVKDGHVIRED